MIIIQALQVMMVVVILAAKIINKTIKSATFSSPTHFVRGLL